MKTIVFFIPPNLWEEINQKYSGLILGLDKSDPCYEIRKECYQNNREENLDSIDFLENKSKKTRKKESF